MAVIMNHAHCMKRGIITISIPPATLSKFSKISQEFLFRREFYITSHDFHRDPPNQIIMEQVARGRVYFRVMANSLNLVLRLRTVVDRRTPRVRISTIEQDDMIPRSIELVWHNLLLQVLWIKRVSFACFTTLPRSQNSTTGNYGI